MTRLLLAAVLTVSLAAAAAGCGSKRDETGTPAVAPLTVALDFLPNADHVGLYAAIADGEFRRVGLDVRPQTPPDPAAPLDLLAAGKVDLAISYEPEVLLARDRGQRLVSVGAIVQRPLTSIIALPQARILKPADLSGTTVGTAGIPYQAGFLKAIVDAAGRDAQSVREVNVGFDLVPAMLTKRVRATLGGFWNYEGVQLKLQRRRPTIIPVDRAGVPTYDELVVVARQDDLSKGAPRVRRFLRALTRGYEAARTNPVKATGQLVQANPTLSRRLQLASVKATLPAFFPASSSKPFGWQEPALWDRFGAWMLRNGLLKRDPNAGAALTNEFLPGQGI